MKYSNALLLIILIPKSGRLESTSGNTAQCIAQASEAPMPNASQLIFLLIFKGLQRYVNATLLQIINCYFIIESYHSLCIANFAAHSNVVFL